MSTAVTIVGLPGSGKSTVARAIAAARGVPVLSTGERLRLLALTDPALATALAGGELGPEDVVQRIVDDFLRAHPLVVLDGYPRHLAQATALQRACPRLWVIHLSISPHLALRRIAQRARRGDDDHQAVQARVARDKAALGDVLKALSPSIIGCDATKPVTAIVSEVLGQMPIEAWIA